MLIVSHRASHFVVYFNLFYAWEWWFWITYVFINFSKSVILVREIGFQSFTESADQNFWNNSSDSWLETRRPTHRPSPTPYRPVLRSIEVISWCLQHVVLGFYIRRIFLNDFIITCGPAELSLCASAYRPIVCRSVGCWSDALKYPTWIWLAAL